jgi:hypothetical protein
MSGLASPAAPFLSPAGRGGARRASDGKVKGRFPHARRSPELALSIRPLTLPLLRNGPLPLPAGERDDGAGGR